MTAFSGIYNSLTGLQGYSAALDVISNNISNLNTAGFKSNEPVFADLGPITTSGPTGQPVELSPAMIGQGVVLARQVENFSEGQLQSTGTPTDLAINGNGFFVVLQNGQYLYTRSGQFSFNGSGELVNSTTGAVVQAVNAAGNLSNLVVDQFQTYPPSPTTTVALTGNLSTGSTSAPATTLNVIDASGAARTLSMTETKNTNTTGGVNSWQVTITDETGATVLSGTVEFGGDGTPEAGFNTLSLNLTSASKSTSTILLNFGQPGATSGVTSFSSGTTSSALQVSSSDGVAVGGVTGVTFNQDGVVQISFSNGKTQTGDQVALASFADPRELQEAGNAAYEIPPGSNIQSILGRPGEAGFGTIDPGNLELANVDLGQEFADIVVLQQGYQGSSQVLNVSSQLLNTLYNALSNR